MKRIRRFLSILLCVCLVAAPLCPAISEDEVQSVEAGGGEVIVTESDTGEPEGPSEPAAPPEAPADPEPTEDVSGETAESGNGDETTPPEGDPVDPAPGDSQGETGPDAGDADPNESGDSNETPPAGNDPAPDGEPEANPDINEDRNPDPNAIDYTRSAAASPAFCQGYAELLLDTAAYAESVAGAEVLGTIGGGVVYVLGRSATEAADRLEVAFDWDGVRYAWVDASRARPMTPDEVTAFVLACAAREDVRTMPDSPELPLDVLECTPAAEGSGEPVATADEAVDAPEANGGEAVAPPAAELVVLRSEFVLGVGQSSAIGARFDDGEKYLIVYTPENEDIVDVSEDGVITALAAGETKILLHSDLGDAEVRATVEDAPTSVRIVAPRTVVGVGEQIQLKAEFPEGGTTTWEFSSSNDAVATVAAGIVMPKAPGTATITVTTANGLTDSVKLTVKPAPASIALNQKELTLGVEQTYQLRATIAPSTAAAVHYEFSSSAEGIVRVDPATGLVTAVAPGSAEISVKTYNQTATCSVTVEYAPKEIAFQKAAITIGLNETATVPLVITAPDGAPEGAACVASYTYSTSNKKIATVSGSGAIKGVKAGTATITVTAHNGAAAELSVTVKKAPSKVSLSASTTRRTLGAGEKLTLTAKPSSGTASYKHTFTSNNSNVLKVLDDNLYDAVCEIEAVGEGKATITVATFNKKKASLTFTVKKAPDSITLNFPEADNRIGVGQKFSVTATLPSGTAGAYAFSSDDEGTLAVDPQTGALTALKPGKARITATPYVGTPDTREIEVVSAPDTVAFDTDSIIIGQGETTQAPAVTIATNSGADCKATLVYTTSNKKIATVSGSGAIKGIKTGTATIKVTAQNGVAAELSVTVKKAPSKVSLSASTTRRTLGVGEKLTLTAKPSSGAISRKLTFTSSKSSIVKVLDDNLNDAVCEIEAVGEGKATITVATFNKKKATLTFTVKKAPDSIALNFAETDNRIGVGQKFSVTATLPAGTAGAYAFSSDNEGTLAVDPQTGALTALKPGKARITATPYVGTPDTKEIEVVSAPDTVAFGTESIVIGQGETTQAPAVTIATNSGADCKATLTYTTSNKKIATVSSSGAIKGIKTGTAIIKVTAQNGVAAELSVTVKKAPSKVSLTASTTRRTLGVGEKVTLTAKPSSGTISRKLTFTSSKSSIVKVLDDNLNDAVCEIEAVGEGKATITVKTFNNKKATLTFTVKKAPDSITLNFPEADNRIGVGQPLSVTATLPAGTAGGYEYRSNNEGTLAVDPQTGALTALQEGSAEITVETYNHKTDTRTITVVPAPQSISLAETSIIIGKGESAKVPAILIDPANGKASFTYKSSKTKVATVNGSGTVSGKNTGSATITVKAHNGAEALLTVAVKKAPSKAYISAHHTTLGVGETLQVKGSTTSGSISRKLTFTSNNPAVLEVLDDNQNDTTCEVKAVSTGSAKITVKTYNGKTASLSFKVMARPDSVTLTPQPLTLGEGETYTISSTTLPEGSGGGRTYSVDPENIATIDATTGKLQALAIGTATVHVKMYEDGITPGATDSFVLTVKAAPTGIELENGNITLSAGDSFQISPPTLQGTDVHSETITYKSSNTKYVTVSSTGKVYAKKKGSAKITVSTFNKKTANFTVTVKDAPKSISFSESKHRLFMNRSFVPVVKFANGVQSTYTLTSSDPNIARVAGDGKTIESVSPGTITLTAKSYNKKTAKMQVWVPELPTSVWLVPDDLTLGEGDSATMTVGVPENAGAEMTYESQNAGVAAVDVVDNETITVTAVRQGTARIHVHSQNGKDGYANVTVKKAPTMLLLSPGLVERSIQEEKTVQLRLSFGGEGEGGRVEFSSSNTGVATVDANGLVTLRKVGTARITARSYNGHEAICNVRVGEKPGEMSFDQENYKVALGDSVRIPATFNKGCESYTFTTSDDCISVSGDTVRGESLGIATLTATSCSGLTATCQVEVVPAPTGIEAETQDVIELIVGTSDTKQLNARPLPDGVGSVHYSTLDPKVAVVDYSTGLVTPKGKGECEIVATTYNGYSTKYKLKISFLLEGKKIGIDPGHQAKGDMNKERQSPNSGGSKYKCAYSSAGVAHVSEHVINLQMAIKLRDALEKLGAEVYLTRETANVNISNKQRAEMMNKLGVDFVLRIHCNSASASSANGLSIIRRKTWDYTKKQTSINGNTVMKQEKKLGDALAYYFKKETGCKWRGLGTSDEYTMNNWSKVPCLLVELGFMTHPTEGKKLVQADYQQKMVRGLVNGICDYYGLKKYFPLKW